MRQMRVNRHHDHSVGISRNGALADVTRMGSSTTVQVVDVGLATSLKRIKMRIRMSR